MTNWTQEEWKEKAKWIQDKKEHFCEQTLHPEFKKVSIFKIKVEIDLNPTLKIEFFKLCLYFYKIALKYEKRRGESEPEVGLLEDMKMNMKETSEKYLIRFLKTYSSTGNLQLLEQRQMNIQITGKTE